MKRTDKEICMAIAEAIKRAAPAEWRKIVVSATVSDDYGKTLYDYLGRSGNMQWFAPDQETQYEVYSDFKELRSLMNVSNQSWGTARISLDRAEKFNVEFDYDK